jgi:hypothetical protein
MDTPRFTRRQFVAASSLGSLAAVAGQAGPARAAVSRGASQLAVRGGTPVRTKGFSGWPVWDKQRDEERVLSVLRSGVWSRSKVVAEFEEKYAQLLGAKRCLATTHGTTALLAALNALDIGVGDEVLVGPYTFVASVSVIFLSGALPIMVDTDRETFLVNPEKMEAKITPNTKAILPVQMYSREQLDHCRAQNECPDNDLLCSEAVCFSQNLLLGSQADMDDIAHAIGKIHENREQLA